MIEPLVITGIIGRSEQGATRPFLCHAQHPEGYRVTCYVKGAYAGLNSLCCEWVAVRLASLLVEGAALTLPPFRMADVPQELIDASVRADVRDLGVGRVFASLLIVGGQELTWSATKDRPEEEMAMLLLLDLWLQNEDRSLSARGGNPNLLVERIHPSAPGGSGELRERLWVYDFNLAFDEDFNRERFFDAHVFGRRLTRWPEGFRERMEPRMREVLGHAREIFGELPAEWLHIDGDDSLPVQLDAERVVSVLELPFTHPDLFWKLP